MRLHDDGRELLAEFMEGHRDSHRTLASVAGYKSHSYIGRLLDPDDPARTVTVEAGTRIAQYYGVRPHRLFVTEASFESGQKRSEKEQAPRRVKTNRAA
jgi:hypothetical protein